MGDASVGSGAGSVLLQSSLWNFLAVRSKAPFSAGPCSISKEMGTDFLQAMQSWALLQPLWQEEDPTQHHPEHPGGQNPPLTSCKT